MTLNIGTTQKKRAATGASKALVGQVVDVLTSWGPRDFIGALQRSHLGPISLVHLNVLLLLESTGPLPMSRLAEALDVSVASVTGIVDRMEARGLVARRRDADDRRVILVEPADGGRRLFDEIAERRRKGLAKLLRQLSEQDLQGLLHGHRALREARVELAQRLAEKELKATVARARASRLAKIDALVGHASARTPAAGGRE